MQQNTHHAFEHIPYLFWRAPWPENRVYEPDAVKYGLGVAQLRPPPV